jgi:hypothetical protein
MISRQIRRSQIHPRVRGFRKGHARHSAGSVTMEGGGSDGANWIRLLLVIEGAISEGEVQILTPSADIRRLYQ